MAAKSAREELHAVGGRSALALVRFETPPSGPVGLEGLQDGISLGVVAMAAPSALPATESGGEAYASDTYSAAIPAAWMRTGLQLRVASPTAAFDPGAAIAIKVGADTKVVLRILPFYLFGATDANTYPLSQIGLPPADALSETFAKLPVGRLEAQAHPALRAEWLQVLIGPRADRSNTVQASYYVNNADQQQDGYAVMDTLLILLTLIRNAGGDGPGPDQFYAPLMMLDSAGKYYDPQGGVGTVGGGASLGDFRYEGLFIHEQGHALGLAHQGDQYERGLYPYIAGSLLGSTWGYDQIRQQFLAPYLPTSARTYAGCRTETVFSGKDAGGNAVSYLRRIDATDRCVKQDPMQSGAGDEASGYRYTMFSDFSTGRMQRYFEGSPPGLNYKPDGAIFSDAAFSSGYKRWNTATLRWVEVVPVTESNGMRSLDMGLPVARNVPVHTIVISLNNAAPKSSLIYPPLTYTGNLLRTIDPSTAAGRADIVPDTGTYPWYCRNYGCDYTVRATYSNGTVRHVALQRAFRPLNQPRGAELPAASDPLSTSSFISWAVNVPADNGGLSKIELLSTPMAWEGVPANPVVLATKTI
ncbi:M66 family metalloprotease [Variovorax sp. W2I14]|uniref:M66 family metalloprotease n=1 Tax=Variovorax sp. W2I14 TaxID=3042290 RepID=UPI003D2473D8